VTLLLLVLGPVSALALFPLVIPLDTGEVAALSAVFFLFVPLLPTTDWTGAGAGGGGGAKTPLTPPPARASASRFVNSW
jgi:hypothetical protein